MSKAGVMNLRMDESAALLEGTGIPAAELAKLTDALVAARREVWEVDAQQYAQKKVPAEKVPLDAGFVQLPERHLASYEQQRQQSELGRILAVAESWRELVDRVVVLGIGGSYMGARALMESCCHPYHNELPRAERGGRPRMVFEGNNVDNDATQGLLDVLGRGRAAQGVDDRWGLVVISKSGGTLETAVAFRQFLNHLRASLQSSPQLFNQLVCPVTGLEGRLRDLSAALGCREVFEVPDGVGGRFSVLSAVGLLPAALLGLDVIKLLQGAAAMNRHFAEADPSENIVLRFVGLGYLMAKLRNANLRILSAWTKSLESLGLWYDQLLAESLGKQERGVTPLTVVNTRDLHSRAQQHQEGARDKLIFNLIVERWRCDPLVVGHSDLNQDKLNAIADRTVPEIMQAAVQGTNQAYREDGRPTFDIFLPQVDEFVMGQLFQMLMLATVVEGRLMGVNPYGQPGVEQYKKHMTKNLGL